MSAIYLDHNATTPLDPDVRAEIERCQANIFGNPSNLHSAGAQARRVVENARAQVARLIGAEPAEIVFTGTGTEANNLAIFGALPAETHVSRHVVTTAVEHQAVLNPCLHLQRMEHRVTLLPVDREGILDPGAFAAALRSDTVLASILLANNDTGVIQPIAALAPPAREAGILLHVDAVQAAEHERPR